MRLNFARLSVTPSLCGSGVNPSLSAIFHPSPHQDHIVRPLDKCRGKYVSQRQVAFIVEFAGEAKVPRQADTGDKTHPVPR